MSRGQRSRPTGLDDELGALVAGEQRHVHDAALHVGTVLVHDGIEFGVAHWVGREGGGMGAEFGERGGGGVIRWHGISVPMKAASHADSETQRTVTCLILHCPLQARLEHDTWLGTRP